MIRLALIFLLFAPLPGLADVWDALRQPGAVAIMRHALAPGTADPANFDVTNCATQRNLDDRGRAQARAIGAAFRKNGIAFDAVISSQWCRCLETAELLGLGPVTPSEAFNSFFETRHEEPTRTADARALLAETPGRLMIVTHQVNIAALTGQATRSGEVLVIRRGDGAVLGSLFVEW